MNHAPANAPDAPAAAAPDDLPVLTGERLRLRGFREDDLPDFFAVHSDPAVNRYWSFPAWTDIAQARDYFADAIAARDATRMLCWVIAERDSDRLIGAATLCAIHREQGRAEIGYALRSSHWGRGYAQDALRLALAHAFEGLALRRVEADIDPRNQGSCRLAERLGFVREGLLRERWHVAGELCDSALYGLLAREWHAVPSDQAASSAGSCAGLAAR
ncbi:GNAT family N-acetyltransferase [Lysobacter sp. D1-1-M9]|uniref:GNAT family N-acetyltransferase n=1 Tax=Novilysobacter longmucuonensis TaxID=3098603 RepID=UPI002FC99B59